MEEKEVYRGETWTTRELGCAKGTRIVVNEEFTRWMARFFVKRYELGKFWQAYEAGKKKGYTGKRLEAYVGTSINNYRKDGYAQTQKALDRFDSLDKHSHIPCGMFSSNISLTQKIGPNLDDVEEKGMDEARMHLPPNFDFTLDLDFVADVKKRIDIFKEKFAEEWHLLEKWMSCQQLTTKEYNILIKAFNSIKI